MAPQPTEEEKATWDSISQQKQMDEFFEWAATREPETMTGKLKRKVKENPLVPVGEFGFRNDVINLDPKDQEYDYAIGKKEFTSNPPELIENWKEDLASSFLITWRFP